MKIYEIYDKIIQKISDETLIQGEYCVVHCTDGYWHDPVKNNRICEKCRNGICPKGKLFHIFPQDANSYSHILIIFFN